ncbi:MAG: transcription-repair coupling factor [Fastidiosipilaceae bacterium]|jgi:transcription-repair coupling factor (superfamily II helicase)
MSEPIVDFPTILKLAERDQAFRELLDASAVSAVNVHGPSDGLKAFLALAASTARSRPVCLVVSDIMRARTMSETLQAMMSNPDHLRIWKTRDFGWTLMDAAGRESEHDRIGTLFALLSGEIRVLVIAAPALVQPIPSPQRFARTTVSVRQGDVDGGPEHLLRRLVAAGYETVNRVDAPGQVARRGDIVDVMPVGILDNRFGTGEGTGYRVSYFDTDVDLIRSFDISSQRSLENLREITVPPAREVIIDEIERGIIADKIRRYAKRRATEMKAEDTTIKARNDMEQLCEHDADFVQAGRDFPGLDRWQNYLEPEQTGILDYVIQADHLIFVDEPIRVRERVDRFSAEQIEQLRVYSKKGQSIPLAEKALINPAQPFRQLDKLERVISLTTIGVSGNGFPGAKNIQIIGRDIDSFRGREKQLIDTLRRRQNAGQLTYITSTSTERREKLNDLFTEYETGANLIHAELARGFEYPAIGLMVIGSQDVFGSDRRRRRRVSSGMQGQKIDLFSDLRVGDAVVHEGYGIGRYEGLVNLETDGVRKDYIKVMYANEDVVYLPMKALDQLQKHIGSGDKKPKLSKLGGKDWSRLKERAKTSIRALATDLVSLYAKRQKMQGFTFAADTTWDREFAASFPYEETEDQLRCIREITADMESERVMDRLLCGDVGFGKTEVAFRAIFKAVMNGKQVAMLAPTTVLTQQHYDNFMERIADFPVRVGLLSRFASKKDLDRTIRGLASGEIDVVIGTHRLLSKDVSFKDLGLLIVDEEQRFGVDHKEKMKNINPTVDVLSLSATPIPRTLHMSMSGIRDISIIEEPPEDRRSIQTYVMEFDEELVVEGINRELERDGQTFYLFNDTRHIHEKAEWIQAAIPGARVAVAHGKMMENQLESVIESFIMGEFDIMVCTTIIESGIDMPNVNTIIVENADRMGLSQLYQLRGRVGRSSRQAYAYITYMRNKVISEESAKRLTAIRDYTELGAGFRIALRDLEVRGAGNLLGAEQHGQLDAIGYDLYCRMLEEEIKSIQAAEVDGLPAVVDESGAPLDTLIDLQIDAYLTSEYISDEGERVDVYRRISLIRNLADYDDVIDELTDRYGDLPLAVITLADLSYVRAQANQSGFSKVAHQKNSVVMTCGRQTQADLRRLSLLLDLPAYKGAFVFSVSGRFPTVRLNGVGTEANRIPSILRRMFASLEKAEAKEEKEAPRAETLKAAREAAERVKREEGDRKF